MMLDMPLDKDPVTASDLANFSVRTFGADALLKSGHEPVRPVFPPDSLFLRNFKRIINPDPNEDDGEPFAYKQLHASLHKGNTS